MKLTIASHASITAVNRGNALQNVANTNKSLENSNQNIEIKEFTCLDNLSKICILNMF